LEAFTGESEKLDQAPKKPGSPHTLIVAGAGLRAADLVRYGLEFWDPAGVCRLCRWANHSVQGGEEVSDEEELCGETGKEKATAYQHTATAS
jgi:hypothetical protein